ncbi:hypothetical protein CERSUDRAFT_89763, partial [Gelatoporia subvermispora B]
FLSSLASFCSVSVSAPSLPGPRRHRPDDNTAPLDAHTEDPTTRRDGDATQQPADGGSGRAGSGHARPWGGGRWIRHGQADGRRDGVRVLRCAHGESPPLIHAF